MKDDENPDTVAKHLKECTEPLTEFASANEDVLLLLPDNEKDRDQTFLFKPKRDNICSFVKEVENWFISIRKQNQDAVSPDDSISVTGAKSKKKSGSHISQSSVSSCSSSSSMLSSTSSVRQREQAKRAALLARATTRTRTGY